MLGGCAQLTEKPGKKQLVPLWQDHRQRVGRISSWDIDGRIGIKTVNQSGTASLFWQQQGRDYEMRIVAPLGQGTYILTGSPERVQMAGPDDLLLTANSAEELMMQGLGWSVNLQGLRYWVRGLPQPDIAFNALELDNEGRLDSLQQSGFNIDIQRYVEVASQVLPEKIVISGKDVKLKLIIKRWQL